MGIITIIVAPIISAITTIFVQWLTKRADKRERENKVRMQRIEKLYAPFYTLCLKSLYPERRSWSTKTIAIEELVELFSDNVVYMSTQSQKLFKDYYVETINLLKSQFNDAEKYEKCFLALARSLQSDYILLCQKLKLEKPLELF